LVESDLENWLRSHKASERRRLDRQSSIANILQHTSPQARQRVTVTLEKQGAAWLAPLRQRLRDEAVAPQRGPAPQTRQATIAAGHQVDALRTSPAAQPPQQAIRPPRDISPAVVEPQRPLPPFDSLATLDASGFAAIARECGADTVVSALAGAAPAMHTLVRRWLPASHYRELMRRIHSLSDVSLRDIDAAQHRMMQVATRLADRSMIAWRPTSHR
jgi:flagellar motor switch protein FliG